MKPAKQKIDNDCFRACMASILELPNNDSLPHISSDNWHIKWRRLLDNFGMDLVFGNRDTWCSGFWLASVPSLNYENTLHSIVMNGNCVEFDPSLKNIYEKGTNLWGKDIVKDCCWLEVSDISKLKELNNYREFLTKQEKTDD